MRIWTSLVLVMVVACGNSKTDDSSPNSQGGAPAGGGSTGGRGGAEADPSDGGGDSGGSGGSGGRGGSGRSGAGAAGSPPDIGGGRAGSPSDSGGSSGRGILGGEGPLGGDGGYCPTEAEGAAAGNAGVGGRGGDESGQGAGGEGGKSCADADSDGVCDADDPCPNDNPDDGDGDGVCDSDDICAGEPDGNDLDGDGTPDGCDSDRDGDTITDADEGSCTSDTDGDDLVDCVDLDSDDDGIADAAEAGDEDPATHPIDTDGDGTPDVTDDDSDDDGWDDATEGVEDIDGDGIGNWIDDDSDGDGVQDSAELGCPDSSNRLLADSDGDMYSDLAELAVGAAPCDAADGVLDHVTYYALLPTGTSVSTGTDTPLDAVPEIGQVDVAFNMDTTGSMGGEINQLEDAITSVIVPGVREEVSDAAFALTSYRDFPVGDFGSAGDYPFRLEQAIATDASSTQAAASVLDPAGGADGPESGFEALYQIATGSGGVSWSGGSIAPFDPTGKEGTIGGVGFRDGSLPVVVHISDAVSHDASDYGSLVSGAHSRAQALDAFRSIRARFVGVVSGSAARDEMRAFALDTGGVVPVCAFEGSGPRLAGDCSATQCCTGPSGSGEAPVNGDCPLVFSVDMDGTGIGDSAVTAITALSRQGVLSVSTVVVGDDTVAPEVDTTCFVDDVVPYQVASSPTCATTPTIAGSTFESVTPGTQLLYEIQLSNDGCLPSSDIPQVYRVDIELWGDGVTLLDTVSVVLEVPPG